MNIQNVSISELEMDRTGKGTNILHFVYVRYTG